MYPLAPVTSTFTARASTEQVGDDRAFEFELFDARGDLFLEEGVHREPAHDLPSAAPVAADGERADQAFGDSVAAVARDRHGSPFTLSRRIHQVADVVDERVRAVRRAR